MNYILHIIDSLARGGAETMLAGTVSSMPQYNHVIITLLPDNDYKATLGETPIICLNYKNKLSIWRCVKKINEVIKTNNVKLIHSHLLTATLLARLSKPRHIPLLFSVHNILSVSAFKISKLSKWLELFFYKKSHTALFVSQTVKDDYENTIGLKGKSLTLYNFIEDEFFQNNTSSRTWGNPIKLVAVGSLKSQKNYPFLIKALHQLKDYQLHIYGEGPLRKELELLIKENDVDKRVKLMGNSANLSNILPDYDLFIMASTYEGFGIAPLEAMAIGIPTFLSNIKTFKEVTDNKSRFFDPEDINDFVYKLKALTSSEEELDLLSKEACKRASKIGNKQNYIKRLSEVYSELCR